AARERVDGGQVRTEPTGNQPRPDREVLVVRARDPHAVRVRRGEAPVVASDGRARRRAGRHAASAPGRSYTRRSLSSPAKTNSPVKSEGGRPPPSPPRTSRSYAATSTNVRAASTLPTPALDTASTPAGTRPVKNSAQQPLP